MQRHPPILFAKDEEVTATESTLPFFAALLRFGSSVPGASN
jgi:hypothetical protein